MDFHWPPQDMVYWAGSPLTLAAAQLRCWWDFKVAQNEPQRKWKQHLGTFTFSSCLCFSLKCPSETLLCFSPPGLFYAPPANDSVTVVMRWNCRAVRAMKQWLRCRLSCSWADGRGYDSMMLAAETLGALGYLIQECPGSSWAISDPTWRKSHHWAPV